MHVLLQKGAGAVLQLEDLMKYARLAEAVVVAPPENSANLLLEVVKASVAANGEQSEQLKKLTAQVMSLMTEQERSIDMIKSSSTGGGAQQRQYKPSPQRQQRTEWSRNAAGERPSCSSCGPMYSAGACRVNGFTCHNVARSTIMPACAAQPSGT